MGAIEEIRKFNLPEYREIPNVGLYLEQVAKYVTESLSPVISSPVTGSMISNYVKKKLVPNPVRKQYDRRQIVMIMFIVIMKMVMQIDDIKLLIDMVREEEGFDLETAYGKFVVDLKGVLGEVFGDGEYLEPLEAETADLVWLQRKMVIAVANKVYLDRYFLNLRNM